MIRLLVRVIALILVITSLALLWLWADTVFLRTSRPAGVETGALLYDFVPQGLNLLQSVVQRYISPELWDSVIVPLLLTEARYLAGGLLPGGLLVLHLTARR